MGAGWSVPRLIFEDELIVLLASRSLGDVRAVTLSWQDSGILGFTIESFAAALRLSADQAEVLFERFDTDQNGKVDALEVMAAQVAICKSTWDEKFSVLVRMFDFAGSDNLSADELHIFIHSTLRGLLKLTENLAKISELSCVPALCERIFDSAASSKSGSISQNNLVRWLDGDEFSFQVLAQWFLARPLDECLSSVSSMHESFTDAFKSASATATSLTALRKAKPLLQVIGNKELSELLEAAHRTTKAPSKTRGDQKSFDRAAKAFAVCKYWTREYKGGVSHGIPAVDIRPALWLFLDREPTDEDMAEWQSVIDARQREHGHAAHPPSGYEQQSPNKLKARTATQQSLKRASTSKDISLGAPEEIAEARRRVPWRAFVDICIDVSMKNDQENPPQIQLGEAGKAPRKKESPRD